MKKLTMMALLACCVAAAGTAQTMAAETEADIISNETEADIISAETEAETEEEPLLAPVYEISDYLEIDDEDYKGLSIEVAPPVQVTEDEIQAYMTSEVEAADLYEETTEGVVEMGDLVNIDYVGTKDGEAFDGGTADNYDLEIGSGSFIDGFEEGLVGQEIGDTVELPLTFPEDYWNEDLAGAEVVFTVTLNAIKELPELTDEIAKKVSGGEYDTLEAYKEVYGDHEPAGQDVQAGRVSAGVHRLLCGEQSAAVPLGGGDVRHGTGRVPVRCLRSGYGLCQRLFHGSREGSASAGYDPGNDRGEDRHLDY